MNKLALAPVSLLLALAPAQAEVLHAPAGEGIPPLQAPEMCEALPAPPAPVAEAPAEAVPEDKETPAPTADEWRTAAPFELARTSAAASSCDAKRVREWLRISCRTSSVGAVKTLGANRRGALLRIEESRAEGSWSSSATEIVFAMRRGDRRVFETLALDFGYRGPSGFSTALVVSEQWIAGEPAPIVTVL